MKRIGNLYQKICSLENVHLADKNNLRIKDNYQIFPVSSRGVNVAGYVHYHGYTILRPPRLSQVTTVGCFMLIVKT